MTLRNGSYDGRFFRELSCEFCHRPPSWVVFEDRHTPTRMYVCHEHKNDPYNPYPDEEL